MSQICFSEFTSTTTARLWVLINGDCWAVGIKGARCRGPLTLFPRGFVMKYSITLIKSALAGEIGLNFTLFKSRENPHE